VLIDCDTCAVRDVACHDCVVGVLLGTPAVPPRATAPGAPQAGRDDAQPGGPLPLEFGPVERRALEVLADHGLIPRLRLVPSAPEAPPGTPPGAAPRGTARRRRARDAG
jgi:hypothetical protein